MSRHGIRVLGVSLNGTGLGHVSRMTGILEACAREFGHHNVLHLTSSYATFVSTTRGIATLMLSSQEAFADVQPHIPGEEKIVGDQMSLAAMTRMVNRRVFEQALTDFDPTHVVIDAMPSGTMRSLAEVDLSGRHTTFVMGCFDFPGYREYANQEMAKFDLVVIPWPKSLMHDYPGLLPPAAVPVGFMTVSGSEILGRAEARQALGFGSELKALVNLGGGRNVETRAIQHKVASSLLEHGIEPVALVTPLEYSINPRWLGGEPRLQIFPVAPYLRAFDLNVSAAGMNSFPDLVRSGVSALMIPKAGHMHSDQPHIAEVARRWGAAEVVSPEEVEDQLDAALARAMKNRLVDPKISDAVLQDGCRVLAETLKGI